MCGIAGTVRHRGNLDRELLLRQRDSMAHRGPDSSGAWFSEDCRIGLAHRRLAIVDLSPGGHQPMVDVNTGSVITFNGEIYNFRELRDRLQKAGHEFHTHSDTEVILAAYREWSIGCVEEFSGMFAFALYDRRAERVLLARDRAGEKPLFYRNTADQFSFASEAKALLCDPNCPRHVRIQSLNEFLAYGYVTGINTMFDGIFRLAPGSLALVDLKSGGLTHQRYWRLPATRPEPSNKSHANLTDELHDRLKVAVSQQLIADVPVGVLLSGGVDSSLITAIAAEVSTRPIRTFTARFVGHEKHDEGPYAKLVAEHLGTEHVELETVAPDGDLLLRLIEQFDEPIADSSMIPTFLVSQEIRKHATVALGGDGGDELFGGYFRYPLHLRHEEIRQRIPQRLRRPLLRAVASVVPRGMPGRGILTSLAGEFTASLSAAGRLFREDERPELSEHLRHLSPAALRAPEALRELSSAPGTIVQRSTSLDFSTYMVDDVLAKVDRASMLTSLEIRAPFLDHRVIEFAFGTLPDELRATRTERKVILRQLGRELLPSTLDLKRKQGFSIPVDEWMRGEWRPLITEIAEDKTAGLLDHKALQTYTKLLERGRPVGAQLFTLALLRLWEKCYGITDVV